MRHHHLPYLLALLALPACAPKGSSTLTGEEEVGRFQVQASLRDTECGAGHEAPAELAFVVDLFHLEGTSRGYWQLPDGPQIDGLLERSGGFRFATTTQAVAYPEDLANDVLGCSLDRTEIVEGVLEDGPAPEAPDGGVGEGEPEMGFSGTTRVRVSASPGGDCRALLSVYGGPFPDLPCVIEYDLDATRVP
ncbi:MAG: hypothetical protein H6719_03850 [Sandaracinaceae bacterium]|nr:hypothetical protein [Sandaracinaceae bacterium]